MTDLKKILIVMSALHGITTSCLALAKKLQGEGVDTLVLSPGEIEGRCKQQDTPFKKLKAIDFDYFDKLKKSNKGYSLNHSSIYQEYHNVSVESDFLDTIEQYSADLIVIDMEMHEHILFMCEQEVSFSLLSPWFSLWPGDNFPPPNSLVVPGPSSATLIKSQWAKERQLRTPSWKSKLKSKFVPTRKGAIVHKLKQLSMPAQSWSTDIWPTPVVYHTMPTISMTAKELDFEGSQKSEFTYIGPQVDMDRYEKLSTVDEQRLEQLHTAKGRKVIVLLSRSSMAKADSSYYDKLLKLLYNREDCVVVTISDGTHVTNPDHITFDWMPQLSVLKLADVCINHGGINTIHECLYSDTPMIIYPGGKHDQNGCLARMKSLDLDTILTLNNLDIGPVDAFIDSCKSKADQAPFSGLKKILYKYENTIQLLTESRAS